YSAFSLRSPSLRALAIRSAILGISTWSRWSSSAFNLSYPVRVIGIKSDISQTPTQNPPSAKKRGLRSPQTDAHILPYPFNAVKPDQRPGQQAKMQILSPGHR